MLKIKIKSVEKLPSNITTSNDNSPISPISPISPRDVSIDTEIEPYCVEDTLKAKGYTDFEEVFEALQGSIFEASKDDSLHIIKATKKSLHNKQVTCVKTREIKVQENIIQEAAILNYLSKHKPPSSLAKFVQFFDDDQNYFLVQEHAGYSLFDFVKDCHNYIQQGLLDISQWISFCKNAMRQMVQLINWLHNTKNCCHLDISLENFCISDVNVYLSKDSKKIVKIDKGFQIKIIDFGLAEVFGTKNERGTYDFSSSKYVGKTMYKSPEVYRKKQVFDARSADVWSLGVTFFMMVVGAPPWQMPSSNDNTFDLIINGQIIDVLYAWDRVHYVTSDIVDLLSRIFVKEKYRLNVVGIARHPSLL